MPGTSAPGAPPAAGLAPSQRALAPDLARGVMLLVIAVVHAHIFRLIQTPEGGYTLSGTLDVVVTGAVTLFAENRGYPMFAALFGYGLTQVYLRRTAEGREWPWVRRLLRRRGRWLVAIGLAHVTFIYYGDIISVYGLVALLFAGTLRYTDRRLLAHAFTWLAVGSLVYTLFNSSALNSAAQGEGAYPAEATALTDLLIRLFSWPFTTPLLVIITVFPFMIGAWAARRRLLEEPERHRDLLRRVAGIGIPLAVLGGVPYALVTTELWDAGTLAEAAAFWTHVVTGYAGGFGYAALIALIAVRIGTSPGPVTRALAATGQRSMTCYLLQSVAWAVLFSPYALGLAGRMSDTAAVATGVGVWLATVVLADLMRRAGVRGPAEAALRRLTYGRPARETAPIAR